MVINKNLKKKKVLKRKKKKKKGLYGFQISLHPCALDGSSLSIGRIKGVRLYEVLDCLSV